MREHGSLISHDRLPYAQLCVMITGADPKQEASTKGLNTGSQCNRGVCVSDNSVMSVGLTHQTTAPLGTGRDNKVNEM